MAIMAVNVEGSTPGIFLLNKENLCIKLSVSLGDNQKVKKYTNRGRKENRWDKGQLKEDNAYILPFH